MDRADRTQPVAKHVVTVSITPGRPRQFINATGLGPHAQCFQVQMNQGGTDPALTLGDSLLSYLSGSVASMAQAVAKQQTVGHDGFGLVVALVHAGDEPLAV